MGLIDAGFLWDTMANRYHPLGVYRKNLKYKDMYRWFNCLEIGPCAGWMNKNETLRTITSKHARQLNNILENLAEKQKFDKFDIHYVANPFKAVLDQWVEDGGEIHELIEPVDSLHPTQAAQALIRYDLGDDTEVGVVTFTNTTRTEHSMVRLDTEELREKEE